MSGDSDGEVLYTLATEFCGMMHRLSIIYDLLEAYYSPNAKIY